MSSLRYTGIIPSRYASSRFPGKPLVMIDGISMIERVYRQTELSKKLNRVIVATDDERIFDHVKNFGGEVVYTSAAHHSGTDRCAEVVNALENDCDVVINIQGDEPYIDPAQIDLLATCFETEGVSIATLIKQTRSMDDLTNPNVVKVVTDKNGRALYFSRSAIPYNRSNFENALYYKHIGIYGYSSDVLLKLSVLPHGMLEQTESLEQLRWLENGFLIQTAVTDIETISIDTPEDLKKVMP